MIRHPRFLHRLYAFLRGYFWLPCPTCGSYFGGHEWSESIPHPSSSSTSVGVCPWCAPTARRAHEALTGIEGGRFFPVPGPRVIEDVEWVPVNDG